MADYRSSSHTVYDIKYHFVWVTKYRYKLLRGKIAERARDILRQGCEANGIIIIKGSVRVDHIHMLLSCPTDMAPSKIMQLLKRRSSKMLQEEFPELKKSIGDSICGQEGTFVLIAFLMHAYSIRK